MTQDTWQPVGVFVGGLRPLPPEGQMTGMYKARQGGPVRCGVEGIEGDRQGDRRVHGGPDKAVHLYPADHYARLAELMPDCPVALGAGVLGENLSVAGIDEARVCIGDVFALGEVRLQVSQLRRPCWKISHRLGVDAASRLVADHGLNGWYFRVVDGGLIPPEGTLTLVDRPAPAMTLARLWAVEQAHRPAIDEVRALAATPGLAAQWAQRLRQRADWLERHPG
ncbi:MOSC domain-containing protein [Nitrogeniibacter mangrovi]|uniref:MOSC domain-containing protein n=1 Tax=Nitrogeniibacter mangrovi TaxID=2016596 RepID=A0A6C1BB58_9RHOO|nr:MOSC domain-containing protein [Nitrogeniibacter mangrovi]QID19640.1 MOSC domain-containing protein [Nitrogeniibacter mangrovi]